MELWKTKFSITPSNPFITPRQTTFHPSRNRPNRPIRIQPPVKILNPPCGLRVRWVEICPITWHWLKLSQYRVSLSDDHRCDRSHHWKRPRYPKRLRSKIGSNRRPRVSRCFGHLSCSYLHGYCYICTVRGARNLSAIVSITGVYIDPLLWNRFQRSSTDLAVLIPPLPFACSW